MVDINVNNNYTDMKNLTPFKLCVLQNFPFIEADFDAVTNYQLLCKVVEYLNKVIDNNNKQNDNITQLEQNFITLYNYVKDYFNNLDVQEEINNKLDEMVQDGTIDIIFTRILKKPPYISAVTIGCDNTGINDCSTIINEYTENYIIFFPKGVYKIENDILLKNVIFGEKDTIINLSSEKTIICDNLTGKLHSLTINSNYQALRLINCLNLSIENITINQSQPTSRNAANFNINILSSSHIYFNNLTINGFKYNEYYQNDGIHINGGCSYIYISNSYIQSSDDVIAINAAEGGDSEISNVYIDNCNCNSIWGIRFYGKGESQKISNIYINNIIFTQWNNTVPCIRFLNGGDWRIGDYGSNKINLDNVNISNIKSNGANNFISFSQSIGNVNISNVKVECTSLILISNSSDLDINFNECTLKNGYLCELNVIPLDGYTADLHNITVNLKNFEYTFTNDNAIITTLSNYKNSLFYNNIINIENSSLNVKTLFTNTDSELLSDVLINMYDCIIRGNSDNTLIITNHKRDCYLYNIISNMCLYNNISSRECDLYSHNINNTFYTDIGSTFKKLHGKITCFNDARPLTGENGSICIIRDTTTLKITNEYLYNNEWTNLRN